MKFHAITLGMAGALGLGALSPLAATEIHNLRSGNGLAGGPDALITYLQGPADAEFGTALTPAQFAAAQGGPQAIILPAVISVWLPALTSDPLAQWINDNGDPNSGSTNLYAIHFTVDTPCISHAHLDFHFAADNWLGEVWTPVNEGLFINGGVVPVTTGGNYASQTDWSRDVSSLVVPGLNTLYILASDVGGPGGLLFSATVRVEGCTTTGAEDLARTFELGAAYPNPFNPVTSLPFSMGETGRAELRVHDLAGRTVATLFSGLAERGAHEVQFDASALPSGLYLYTLSTESGSQTRKLVLAK